jgi:hypothetical protein
VDAPVLGRASHVVSARHKDDDRDDDHEDEAARHRGAQASSA